MQKVHVHLAKSNFGSNVGMFTFLLQPRGGSNAKVALIFMVIMFVVGTYKFFI